MAASVKLAVRRSANGHSPAGPPLLRAGQPVATRQKHPAYVALCGVLVVGLALLFAYFYAQAGAKQPAVVVVNTVEAGHTIIRSDLSTVMVAGDVTGIAGANLNSVVGQTAAVPLLPHTLLTRAMVSAAPALSGGDARVGVQLKPGQVPAGGLSAGDRVEVLQLPPKDAAASAAAAGNGSGSAPSATVLADSATVLADSATVWAVAADPSQSGGSLVTVVVSKSAAAAVATASNAGLVAMVEVGS